MTPRSFRLFACLTLCAAACGKDDDTGAADDASSSGDATGSASDPSATGSASLSDTTPSTTAMADDSSGSDASAEGSTDDGSSTGDAPTSCGDGIVDDGEECDDGNRVDSDGCNVDCVPSGSVRWELLYDAPAGQQDCAYDVAANAGLQLGSQCLALRSRECVGARDFSSDFTALCSSQPGKSLCHCAGFGKAAVVGKDAQCLGGQRIELHRLGDCGNGFLRRIARNRCVGGQRRKVGRIDQCLLHHGEAGFDFVDSL